MFKLKYNHYLRRKDYIHTLNKVLRGYSSKVTINEVDVEFSNGRNIKISSGKYAKLADSCAVATIGDTSVMVTAVSKTKPSLSNFLPLVVDYRQKSAAAGRIPTNFLRRELGPSEREVLTSRLIDRSLRPLFNDNYFYDTQIVCNMLAVDGINNPDVVSINAASAALAISDIPWNGPVGAVRLGLVNGDLILNPTRKELQSSTLNLVVSATKHNLVVMLEGHAENIYQQDLLKAIKYGTKEAQHVITAIDKLQRACGKPKRQIPPPPKLSAECSEAIRSLGEMRVTEILTNYTHNKLSRDAALTTVRQDVLDKMRANYPQLDVGLVQEGINDMVKQRFRELVMEGKRCDGRGYTDLRDVSCEVNMYRPLHGSSVFTRGQTQVFCTVTLDSPQSALKMDPVAMLTSGIKTKNFFLHYEFPPFATNETGRVGGALGRRELGHGALAEKALAPTLPETSSTTSSSTSNTPPFTIRLSAEVLESNGSSSMATVCAGSLALMDAGVAVNAPAAGVAIGLISRHDEGSVKGMGEYRILTDLLGIEDYMGDMDFKIAGTKKGITALQADIKIPGLPLKVIMEAIQSATDAKHKILDIMHNCINKPRVEKKENWPVSEKLEVEVHKRARLLGIGGINIKKLFVETGVQVNQIDDTRFEIFAPSQSAMDEAQEIIQKLLTAERAPELEFGGIYPATIVEVRDIGVMVTLYPGMSPALLHNSQLDQRKVAHPSVLGLEVGNEMQVKYFGRDPVSGLMRISRKVLQTAAR